MKTLSLTSRKNTFFLAFAGIVLGGFLAIVVMTALAFWRLAQWGTDSVESVRDTTVAVVSHAAQEARQSLSEAERRVAASAAHITTHSDATIAAAEQATASLQGATERVTRVLSEPEGALQRLAAAAAHDVSRAIPVDAVDLAGRHAETAARALDGLRARDPNVWPTGLALTQTHFRDTGTTTEYGYVATGDGLDLDALRRQLQALGYEEHVLARSAGGLEAIYRAQSQLVLTVTTRDGQQHIDVREMQVAVAEDAGP